MSIFTITTVLFIMQKSPCENSRFKSLEKNLSYLYYLNVRMLYSFAMDLLQLLH